MTSVALGGAFRAGRAALHGQLPSRYAQDWLGPFRQLVEPTALRPGVRILDLGSGRTPTIPVGARPTGCFYVGLDISSKELARAQSGAYHEVIVADATVFQSELCAQFDLIVSWQVLEHVKPLGQVLDNLRAYLRPNGRLVAMLSGAFSLFALLNRVIPHRLGAYVVAQKMGKGRDEVFPAHYDRCYHDALALMLSSWRQHEIIPLYRAANYFDFVRLFEAIYITYEEWLVRSARVNLATHYLIAAAR